MPMDLSKLKGSYRPFLSLLEEKGYRKSTIDKYRWIINRLLNDGESSCFDSFEDYFLFLKGVLSPKSHPEVQTYLGTLKYYLAHGEFHRNHSFRSGFLSVSSYTQLNTYYRGIIDYSHSVISSRYASNTVSSVKSAASVFCLHLIHRGYNCFDAVKSQRPILEYFNDGITLQHCSAHSYHISLFLSIGSDMYPECGRILTYVPMIKDWKKNYDGLTQEEMSKIRAVLSGNNLILRDRAICATLYYTGLRSSDVAGLTLDSIDLDCNLIALARQRKTGEPLTLPLHTTVRGTICEYVEKERPCADDDHIFLTLTPPYKGMASGSINNVVDKILDLADVRTKNGHRGTHLFRHALVSDLIGGGVPRQYVSRLLGHTSLRSLDAYVDADIEHLRLCALSIQPFCATPQENAVRSPFRSGASQMLQGIIDGTEKAGELDSCLNRTLYHLDRYLLGHQDNSPMTQGILDEWASPEPDESAKRYQNRMQCREVLNRYLESYNLHVTAGQAPDTRGRNRFRSEFISPYRQLFKDYVEYQKASLRWNETYDYALKSFDASCKEHMQDSLLCQTAIDQWSRQKQSENLASCGKRTSFLSSLCKYANRAYGTNLIPPHITTRGATNHVPHIFTRQELKNLFTACDSIKRRHKSRATMLRALVVPAMFRLMYSSGMRPIEARMLDCSDVNLRLGIINITHTKGLNEHRIALHKSIRDYLAEYDRSMQTVMPDRNCFFPNEHDGYYSSTWIRWNFEAVWYLYNGEYAAPYDFRHNYAIENINSWPADREVFDKNLIYLSRSMGHSGIEQTMYYYSFTPRMAESISNCKEATFEDIVNDFIPTKEG